jgi:hypothetical protein
VLTGEPSRRVRLAVRGGPRHDRGEGRHADGLRLCHHRGTGTRQSVYFSFSIRPLKAISNEFAGVYTTGLQDPNADYNLGFAKVNLSATKA